MKKFNELPINEILLPEVVWGQETRCSWVAICVVEHKIRFVLAEMLRENVVDFIAIVEAEITRDRIYFIGTIGSVEVSISINP